MEISHKVISFIIFRHHHSFVLFSFFRHNFSTLFWYYMLKCRYFRNFFFIRAWMHSMELLFFWPLREYLVFNHSHMYAMNILWIDVNVIYFSFISLDSCERKSLPNVDHGRNFRCKTSWKTEIRITFWILPQATLLRIARNLICASTIWHLFSWYLMLLFHFYHESVSLPLNCEMQYLKRSHCALEMWFLMFIVVAVCWSAGKNVR